MLNNIFNQKRNSMSEADRRKQQQYYQQYQQLLNAQKNGQQSIEQDSKRLARSANSSPVTYLHQAGENVYSPTSEELNGHTPAKLQQPQLSYSSQMEPPKGSSSSRPQTSNIIIQSSHNPTKRYKMNPSDPDPALEIKYNQTPKTSNKIDSFGQAGFPN